MNLKKWLLSGLVAGTILLTLTLPKQTDVLSKPESAGQQVGGLAPEVRYPEKFDILAALSDVPQVYTPNDEAIPQLDLPLASKLKKSQMSDQNVSADRVIQDQPGTPNVPSPTLNIEGLNNVNGVYPPDTQGDAGPNHYVQWVNVSFAIWSVTRDGTGQPTGISAAPIYGPVNGNTLWTGFGGPCETTNHGDPITLYDHLAGRWFMSQMSHPTTGGPYYQCIAISQTSDPTAGWYRYAYLYSDTKLNDYPKFGVWPDAYYMSADQLTYNGSGYDWAGGGALAFERAKLLNGDPSAAVVYFDMAAYNIEWGYHTVADLDGQAPPNGAPGLFMEWDNYGWVTGDTADTIRLWEFHVNWSNPLSSTFGVSGQPNVKLYPADASLMPCSSRSCIPQPGTSVGLDAISGRLMYRLNYRNYGSYQAMTTNMTVDAGSGQAGIRWFEFRNSGSGWTLRQDSTFAPADGLHRWMGSIAQDLNGNLALGYSVSSSSVYPSIRYTGRLASDPLNSMGAEMQIIAGSGSQTGTGYRWGDYSMMGIDPVDQKTFWYTQEYIQTTGTAPWRTRIATFRFPDSGTPTPTPTATITPTPTQTPTPTLTPTPTATPQPSGQWVTIHENDFEGAFPGPGWQVGDGDGSTNGDYAPAKRNCRAYQGSNSIWMIGGGANGAILSCGSNYPAMVTSWLIYGPFSLQDALDAKIDFKLWLKTEADYDELFFGASIDGSNFYGLSSSGDTGGWTSKSFSLKNVYTLGDLTGQSSVWFAYHFTTDSTNTFPEGAFIDDFEISKFVSGSKVSIPVVYKKYGFGKWEVEPNNTSAQANGPLLSGIPYNGYHNDEKDYFYFDVTNPGAISVELSTFKTSGLQVQLFYGSTYIDYAYKPPYKVQYNGQAGRYYVYLFNSSGYNMSDPYTITVTHP